MRSGEGTERNLVERDLVKMREVMRMKQKTAIYHAHPAFQRGYGSEPAIQ